MRTDSACLSLGLGVREKYWVRSVSAARSVLGKDVNSAFASNTVVGIVYRIGYFDGLMVMVLPVLSTVIIFAGKTRTVVSQNSGFVHDLLNDF